MYFDEYHSEWTSFKDKAFKGFVLKKIDRILDENC